MAGNQQCSEHQKVKGIKETTQNTGKMIVYEKQAEGKKYETKKKLKVLEEDRRLLVTVKWNTRLHGSERSGRRGPCDHRREFYI